MTTDCYFICSAVQERAQALLDQADAECRGLMNEFAVQLVKLPKQVRVVLHCKPPSTA